MNKRFLLVIVMWCALLGCTSVEQTTSRDEVIVRIDRDPVSINPVVFVNASNLMMINLLYQGLYQIDPGSHELKPLLAAAVAQGRQSGDSALFDVQLRSSARWPNGQSVTAIDVLFSLKLINCPGINNTNSKPLFRSIKNLIPHPTDPLRFQLICEGDVLPNRLLIGDFPIVPKVMFDSLGLLDKVPLTHLMEPGDTTYANVAAFAQQFTAWSSDPYALYGSGPYQLTEWEEGQYVKFEKKANWWGDSLAATEPHFEAVPPRLNFQVIPADKTAVFALRNGLIDVMGAIPSDEFDVLKVSTQMQEDYHLLTNDTYRITYIGINSRKSKLADTKTRQAIAHLTDVEQIIKLTLKGYGRPTVGFIHPQDPNYNQEIVPYTYSTAKAGQLLSEAGWRQEGGQWLRTQATGEDEVLSLRLSYASGSAAYENAALMFANAATQLGIELELVPMERRSFIQSLRSHDFELFISSKSGSPSAYNFMQFLHSRAAREGGANYTGFGNAESDELVSHLAYKYNSSTDRDKVLRFQELVHDDAQLVFLYFSQNRLAVSKRFAVPATTVRYPYVDIPSLRTN